jgi:hypothetical protein
MSCKSSRLLVIYDLGPDQVSEILSYLTSKELMTIKQVDKRLLGGNATTVTVKNRLRSDFGIDVDCDSKSTPLALYELEVKSILAALRSPHSSSSSRGFWISTQWISTAQVYYNNIYSRISEINDIKLKKKGKSSNTNKKLLSKTIEKPTRSINSEITCPHGHLSTDKTGSRAQRRIISQQHWNIIKAYHNPLESDLNVLNLSECKQCFESKSEILIQSIQAREMLKASRLEKVSPGLSSLLNRKNGIPWRMKPSSSLFSPDSSCPSSSDSVNSNSGSGNIITSLSLSSLSINDDPGSGLIPGVEQSLAAMGGGAPFSSMSSSSLLSSIASDTVLLKSSVSNNSEQSISNVNVGNTDYDSIIPPGIYAVIPHYWLQSWRHYVKDPAVSYYLKYDPNYLKCARHSKIVIPTHLEDYLLGIRQKLLRPLPLDNDLIIELISLDELELLNSYIIGHGFIDSKSCAKFSFDGENLTWNSDICMHCDSKSLILERYNSKLAKY